MIATSWVGYVVQRWEEGNAGQGPPVDRVSKNKLNHFEV